MNRHQGRPSHHGCMISNPDLFPATNTRSSLANALPESPMSSVATLRIEGAEMSIIRWLRHRLCFWRPQHFRLFPVCLCRPITGGVEGLETSTI